MKKFITWEQYDNYINKIFDWIDQLQRYQGLNIGAVYGLPRGGLPLAVSLSHELNLPLLMDYYDRKIVTDKQVLVVDDIADTGHTLKSFENKYSIIADKIPFQEYIQKLQDSKICISPFGMGELCFRDFESILMGTIILRPDQSNIITSPNVYVEGETYIGCKLDWSDLEEKVDFILSNFNELNQKINYNVQTMIKKEYTDENFCMHYYNIFKNVEGVENE